MQLEDRTAIVTGASGGIGQVIASALAAEGADVVLAARSAEGLEETSELVTDHGREALSVETDVTDPDAVQRLADAALERFGKVDLLVNNSGVEGPTKELWEISPEDWRQVLDVNLYGAFLSSRAVLPSMVERGEGSVVMIGSILARRPLWGRTPVRGQQARPGRDGADARARGGAPRHPSERDIAGLGGRRAPRPGDAVPGRPRRRLAR